MKIEVSMFVNFTDLHTPRSGVRGNVFPALQTGSGEQSTTNNPVTVNELLSINFSKLSVVQKMALKKRGRDTPDLPLVQETTSNGKKYKRKFTKKWYRDFSWICGCTKRNSLHCFPCLLVKGKNHHGCLTNGTGLTNVAKIHTRSLKHEKSASHINNCITVQLLGSFENPTFVVQKRMVEKHNARVAVNFESLETLVDVTLLGYEENNECFDTSLIGFLSDLSPRFNHNLRNSNVFSDMNVQKEVLEAVFQAYQETVVNEIKQVLFVSILVIETMNISDMCQLTIIVRYCTNGNVHERFWGFFCVEGDMHSAEDISKTILKALELMLGEDKDKLIGQAYDGTSLTSECHAAVQKKIKAIYKNAHYVHAYNHKLDLCLQNAINSTQESRDFFLCVSSIMKFFAREKRDILKKHINSQSFGASNSKWNIEINTFKCIEANLPALCDFFKELKSEIRSGPILREVDWFLFRVNDSRFHFWLFLFHRSMSITEELYLKLVRHETTVSEACEIMEKFKADICELSKSKMAHEEAKAAVKLVMENFIFSVCHRFENLKSFHNFSKLFDPNFFSVHEKYFPQALLVQTCEAFPTVLDQLGLSTELAVFYARTQLHHHVSGANSLLAYLINADFLMLPEISKLAALFATLPLPTEENRQRFTTCKKIEDFLQISSEKDKSLLNARAVISMQRDVAARSNIPFKKLVIHKYLHSKGNKAEFIYKQSVK